MKKQTRSKIAQIYKTNKFQYTKQLIEAYKDGYSLIELCYLFHTDALTILKLIKKAKLTDKQLYLIFTEQEEHHETIAQKKRKEKEQYLLTRYFPLNVNDITTKMYWRYVIEKNNKREKEKEQCKHSLKHIRCAKCGKILGDASDYQPKP